MVKMVGGNNMFRTTPHPSPSAIVAVNDFSIHMVLDSVVGSCILIDDSLGSSMDIRITADYRLRTFDGTDSAVSSPMSTNRNIPVIISIIRSGSTVTFFENNTSIGSGTFAGTFKLATIGGGYQSSSAMNGYFGVVLQYSVAHSADERSLVYGYLGDRYGKHQWIDGGAFINPDLTVGGYVIFSDSSSGTATAGAGDSVVVNRIGLTANAHIQLTYLSNSLLGVNVASAGYHAYADKFTIFADNGKTVSFLIT